jgi:serine phosphatase RsbU (regulator of sigma subunit)/pterin-4a-carbinolamine dehydratase
LKTIFLFLFFVLLVAPFSIGQTDETYILLEKEKTYEKKALFLLNKSSEVSDDNPGKAIEYAKKGLEFANQSNSKAIVIDLNTFLSHLYSTLFDYKTSLDFANRAQSLSLKSKDSLRIADSYYNLSGIYYTLKNFNESLSNAKRAAEIYKKLNHKDKIGLTYNTLAINYEYLDDFNKADSFYILTLKEFKNHGDENDLGLFYMNYADFISKQNRNQESNMYFKKALDIFFKIQSKDLIANAYGLMSDAEFRQNNCKQALDLGLKSMELFAEIGDLYNLTETYSSLSNYYNCLGNIQAAYDYLIKSNTLKDSILGDENIKMIANLQIAHESDQKEKEIKLLNSEKALKDIQLSKNKTTIVIFASGFLIVLVLSFIAFNQLKQRKKANKLVEKKHKEITDSINYAERIQRSFLASKELLDENLGDYFVFFKPKDIVSGDFYWAGNLNDGNFALCCADSTGHGVPGAIMSILNISSLEKSIEHETEAHEIFNATRKIIVERLKKDGSPLGGRDGMDGSLLIFNKEKTKLSFSSANNPIFIIRNKKIIEFKPDKMPIGKHDKENESFTLQSTDLQLGDLVYTLTDGFADQFGRVENPKKEKKYMIKNLKSFLLKISNLPMEQQKQNLNDEFEKWKGDLEQVDDVCIVGIRI